MDVSFIVGATALLRSVSMKFWLIASAISVARVALVLGTASHFSPHAHNPAAFDYAAGKATVYGFISIWGAAILWATKRAKRE